MHKEKQTKGQTKKKKVWGINKVGEGGKEVVQLNTVVISFVVVKGV
jgi:hypothetical protein